MSNSKNRLERIIWRIRDHRIGAGVALIGVAVIALGSFFGAIERIESFIRNRIPLTSEADVEHLLPLPPAKGGDWRYDKLESSDAGNTASIETAYLKYDSDGFPALRFLVRNSLNTPTSIQSLIVHARFLVGAVGGGPETILATRELVPVEYVIDLTTLDDSEPTNVSDHGRVEVETRYDLPNPIVIAPSDFVAIEIKLVATEDGYLIYPTRRSFNLTFSFLTDRGKVVGVPEFITGMHLDADRMFEAAGCKTSEPLDNIIPARRLCE